MPRAELQLVGHICVDIAPGFLGPIESVPGALSEVGAAWISVGGAVGNGALAAAGLGRAAALAGTVGADPLGEVAAKMLEPLARGGVNLTRSATAATSYSIVIQPPDSDRSFWHHTGANDEFDGRIELVGAPFVHFGYPTLVPKMTSSGGAPTVDLFRRAKAQGSATSLDLSYCAVNSPLRGYDWDGYFQAVLPWTDVFCPSWDDLVSVGAAQGPADPPLIRAAAQEFLARGARIVLISMGERGSFLATSGADGLASLAAVLGADTSSWAGVEEWIPAAPVVRFVTSNGAGDTFKIAFLLGLIDGRSAGAAAAWAAQVAARKIEGSELSGESA